MQLNERLKHVGLVDLNTVVIDDFPEPIVEEVPEFVPFTPEQQARIKSAITGSPDQVSPV